MKQGRSKRKTTAFPQGAYGEGSWICPNDETMNTGETCVICGYRHSKLKTKSRLLKCIIWASIAVTAVLVCLIMIRPIECAVSGEHKWHPGNCQNPDICEVCGITRESAIGHIWIPAKCETPKACVICEKRKGNALGHQWEVKNNHKICRRCHKVIGIS